MPLLSLSIFFLQQRSHKSEKCQASRNNQVNPDLAGYNNVFSIVGVVRVILFEANEVRAKDRLRRKTRHSVSQMRKCIPGVHTATRVAGTYRTTMKLRTLSIFESRRSCRARSVRVSVSFLFDNVMHLKISRLPRIS